MRTHRTMTPAAIVATLAGTTALAQTVIPIDLYSNADPRGHSNPGIATGAMASDGSVALPPAVWSEAQPNSAGTAWNAVGGFNAHVNDPAGSHRFADDFRVGNTEGWRIDVVSLYAYVNGAESQLPTPCIFTVPAFERDPMLHPGLYEIAQLGSGRDNDRITHLDQAIPFPVPNPGITSPFDNVNLQIWNGPPNEDSSLVVWGDADTNVFADATRMNIYRIFNATSVPLGELPNSKRSVWQIDLDIGGLELPSGRYWLDWQYRGSTEAFCPAISLKNRRTSAGWNAMQFVACDFEWRAALDRGKPAFAADVAQDMPFVLRGKVVCPADWNDDNTVNVLDLLSFLALWFPQMDMTAPNGPGSGADFNGDGRVDIIDLLELLTAWFEALDTDCPDPIDRRNPTILPIEPIATDPVPTQPGG